MERGTEEFLIFDEEMAAEKERRADARKVLKRRTRILVTVAQVEAALIAYKGNVTEAAKHLGYPNPAYLRQRIARSARLSKLSTELINRVTDLAESKVVGHIEEGNLTAAIFWLKTQGKERGYSEKSTVEHEVGPNLRKDAAALIEMMRRGSDSLVEDDGGTWVVEPRLLEEK